MWSPVSQDENNKSHWLQEHAHQVTCSGVSQDDIYFYDNIYISSKYASTRFGVLVATNKCPISNV